MSPADHRASGPHIARNHSRSHDFTLYKAFFRGVQSANVRMIVDDASARELCVMTSRYTGLEYAIVFDMFTGEVIGQRSGEPDSAGFSPATREAALDSQRKLKVIHSHPKDEALSLSPVDLIVLWDYEEIYEIEAVTLDGSWFLARAGSQSRELSKAYVGRVFNDLYKICLDVKGHDPLSPTEAGIWMKRVPTCAAGRCRNVG